MPKEWFKENQFWLVCKTLVPPNVLIFLQVELDSKQWNWGQHFSILNEKPEQKRSVEKQSSGGGGGMMCLSKIITPHSPLPSPILLKFDNYVHEFVSRVSCTTSGNGPWSLDKILWCVSAKCSDSNKSWSRSCGMVYNRQIDFLIQAHTVIQAPALLCTDHDVYKTG